jgi:hypothetical protein
MPVPGQAYGKELLIVLYESPILDPSLYHGNDEDGDEEEMATDQPLTFSSGANNIIITFQKIWPASIPIKTELMKISYIAGNCMTGEYE